ncbi:MAG: sporulation protein YqfD [Clostridiales bacterium]|nr:sporulation protein YqfD [Clostridiales bacterium]
MLKRFVRWLFGYLYITLKGDYPEHFMNLCENRNILLWGIRYEEKQCFGFIKLRDYRTVKDIARKSKTVPYIKKRYGFPFFLKRVWKRKVYFIGILLFCMLLFTMSRYIWDISIEGGHKHTPEQLLSYLKSTGVYSGCTIQEISCPKIEEDLRRDYPDIGWVSAQIKGTRLIVSIVETEVPVLIDSKKETNLSAAHIVANQDGIIASMIVRSGVPKVKIGSVVKKGDILVSGVIPVIGDEGVPTMYKSVVADADIMVKTYVDYDHSFSMTYQSKKYTKEKKTGYQLDLWDRKIFNVGSSNSYEHYDIIKDVNTLKLVRNFYLPIKITKINAYEYKTIDVTYTESEALSKAGSILLRYLEILKKNGASIIENQVQTKIMDGVCNTSGKIIMIADTWGYKEINDDEWRIPETDEHNGVDN